MTANVPTSFRSCRGSLDPSPPLGSRQPPIPTESLRLAGLADALETREISTRRAHVRSTAGYCSGPSGMSSHDGRANPPYIVHRCQRPHQAAHRAASAAVLHVAAAAWDAPRPAWKRWQRTSPRSHPPAQGSDRRAPAQQLPSPMSSARSSSRRSHASD